MMGATDRKILIREINLSDNEPSGQNKHIRLMMISCEDSEPYGPSDNVAVSEEDSLFSFLIIEMFFS